MNIVGQKVMHNTFGIGTIAWYGGKPQNNNKYIKVEFDSKNLELSFPSCFETHLTALEEDFAKIIEQELAKTKIKPKEIQEQAFFNKKIYENKKYVNTEPAEKDKTQDKTPLCETAVKKTVNQVHRPISYCSKNTFTFLSEERFNKERNRSGFTTLDNEGRVVAVASMHTDIRGPAYGQAELCFYDEYAPEFGQWRLVSINKERLSFNKLIKLLEENDSWKLTIDPRKGS